MVSDVGPAGPLRSGGSPDGRGPGAHSMLTFRSVIDAHAAAQPRAPFLIAPEPGVEIDYATLRDSCVAFAGWLDARGVRPRATVSFMLENGVSAASAFLGAMYGGYVVSPVNLLAQDAQLEYTLAHSETSIVIASASDAARLERIRHNAGAGFDIAVIGSDGIPPSRSLRSPLRRACAGYRPRLRATITG